MALRVCTLDDIPAFRHGGLVVGPRWAPLEKLKPAARDALRDFHGRFVRIHPEDIDQLREYGLAFKDKKSPLVDTKKKPTTTDVAAGDTKER